ncbi:hypothetical protein [Angustibacter luteus]|uniref:Uncharacterized protein n=1 Tax=Angustibacter luteus TaxID=658456 RepID=A0ABW1JAR1_9ACTN
MPDTTGSGTDQRDEDDDFEPWTADGASRLRIAAADLLAALAEHAETVASAAGDADVLDVFAANDRLLPLAMAYADAQFDYTGNFGPFGALTDDDGDEADGEDDEGPTEESVATGFTVLERRDYAVTDEAAVLAAADADHLGRALHQIAEAGGWHSLGDSPGLRRQAGFVAVVQHDALLAPDPADWPQDLTIEDGELLYEQRDAY